MSSTQPKPHTSRQHQLTDIAEILGILEPEEAESLRQNLEQGELPQGESLSSFLVELHNREILSASQLERLHAKLHDAAASTYRALNRLESDNPSETIDMATSTETIDVAEPEFGSLNDSSEIAPQPMFSDEPKRRRRRRSRSESTKPNSSRSFRSSDAPKKRHQPKKGRWREPVDMHIWLEQNMLFIVSGVIAFVLAIVAIVKLPSFF